MHSATTHANRQTSAPIFAVALPLLVLLATGVVWTLPLPFNTQLVLTGTGLLGASAGMIGSFAVLWKRALVGDALAHSALPGICLAFLLLGYRSLPWMLVGALVSGLLGLALIATLRRWSKIREDAAIGIVLSVFFGGGVVLVRLIQNTTVQGSKAGLDSFILGKTAGMVSADVAWIAGTSLAIAVCVGLLFKEFRLTLFDAEFARAQGWPTLLIDFGLMALIALTVVIGLPAVGVVLMSAMLVLPAASARFWTDDMSKLIPIAALFGLLHGMTGTLVSNQFAGLPTGPIIALCGTAYFAISALFAPRRGMISRTLAQRRFRSQILRQALLTRLHEHLEKSTSGEKSFSLDDCSGHHPPAHRQYARLLSGLEHDGLVESVAKNRYEFTQRGWQAAQAEVQALKVSADLLLRFPELSTSHAIFSAAPREDDPTQPTVRPLTPESEKSDAARRENGVSHRTGGGG